MIGVIRSRRDTFPASLFSTLRPSRGRGDDAKPHYHDTKRPRGGSRMQSRHPDSFVQGRDKQKNSWGWTILLRVRGLPIRLVVPIL